MNYKEKLRQFNSTAKYMNELEFLLSLLDLQHKEKALDYGCGLGTAMEFINERTDNRVIGFDVAEDLYEGDPVDFKKEIWFKVEAIYFMHSISHIPDAHGLLRKCKELFLNSRGKLVIISPNPAWLALKNNPGYIPDPTVIKHHSLEELMEIVTDAGFKITMHGQFGEKVGEVNERVFIKALS